MLLKLLVLLGTCALVGAVTHPLIGLAVLPFGFAHFARPTR